jgi:hypothetical protein
MLKVTLPTLWRLCALRQGINMPEHENTRRAGAGFLEAGSKNSFRFCFTVVEDVVTVDLE